MKRCTQTHEVRSFGSIPEGSLWEDDSPFITDESLFEDVDTEPVVKPKKAPTRKFGVKVDVDTTAATEAIEALRADEPEGDQS